MTPRMTTGIPLFPVQIHIVQIPDFFLVMEDFYCLTQIPIFQLQTLKDTVPESPCRRFFTATSSQGPGPKQCNQGVFEGPPSGVRRPNQKTSDFSRVYKPPKWIQVARLGHFYWVFFTAMPFGFQILHLHCWLQECVPAYSHRAWLRVPNRWEPKLLSSVFAVSIVGGRRQTKVKVGDMGFARPVSEFSGMTQALIEPDLGPGGFDHLNLR